MTQDAITEGRRLAPPALRATSIDKSFVGTRALRGVDVEIARGEIHGLVGENGCGKSTLVKILAGVYQADAGTVEAGGTTIDAAKMTPAESRRCGIRAVHQDTPTFPAMTVADNLMIGGRFPTRAGRIDRGAVRRQAQDVLDRFHIPARPDEPAVDLDFAVRAMVAIARELQDRDDASDGILILDEPTAGLSEPEVETLLGAIRRYAAEGQAIVLVTHRLDEILDACDRVTVLRDGALVASREREGLDRRELVSLIVGRELEREYEADAARVPDPSRVVAARLTGVSAGPVRDVTLDVHAGEIVGLAGLVGSGGSELLQAVYGSLPRTGSVVIGDRTVRGGDVRAALRQGVSYVPQDRGTEAAFTSLTVRENLSVGELRGYWRHGFMTRRGESSDARALIQRFDIQPPDERAAMVNLSGGNQQKVVMARALRRNPSLLLLDEPTQGVDVGARAQIHHAIRDAADGGAGALVVSSDLEEMVRLCDRVVVLVSGRVVAELEGDEIDRDTVATLIHQEVAA